MAEVERLWIKSVAEGESSHAETGTVDSDSTMEDVASSSGGASILLMPGYCDGTAARRRQNHSQVMKFLDINDIADIMGAACAGRWGYAVSAL